MATTQIANDWLENKAARMIAVAKASQFACDIFAEAREFHRDGFAMDVALAKSLRYWVGNPVTGYTPGVDD